MSMLVRRYAALTVALPLLLAVVMVTPGTLVR